MTIRAHKKALLDRLEEDSILAGKVHEGVVPKRVPPYVSLFTDTGSHQAERFIGPDMTVNYQYLTHSVGETPEQAQLLAEHVAAQFLNWVPAVSGYRCSRLRHPTSPPTQLDRDVDPPLFYCIDEWDLTSRQN